MLDLDKSKLKYHQKLLLTGFVQLEFLHRTFLTPFNFSSTPIVHFSVGTFFAQAGFCKHYNRYA